MDNNIKQFRVVFRGKVAKKFSRDQVSKTLGKMIGKPPASLAPIFSGEQKISFSKKPLDFQTAVKLKVKLLRLGLVTEIQPWKKTHDKTPPAHSPAPTASAVAEEKTTVESAPPAVDDSARADEPDTEVSIVADKPENADTSEALTGAEPAPAFSTQQTTPKTDTSGNDDHVASTDDASTEEAATGELLERLEKPPRDITIINADDEAPDEPSTSETIFHEHPYVQPWWKRIVSWRASGIVLVLLAVLGYWVYTLTTFTASSAAQVIENHLATKNLSMIGLIDINKLKATARWMNVDAADYEPPVDLAFLEDLEIDLAEDISSIVISQHDVRGQYPTTIVLLGQFDEEKIRATLETRLGAIRDEDNKNRLRFRAGNDASCNQQLGIHIDHNEIILTSADFIAEAYTLIHESFDGKPAMLKAWRAYREHHPVSFNVMDAKGLSYETEEIIEGMMPQIDLDEVEEILLGIDISNILAGDAIVSLLIRSSDQQMLDATAKALETSSPLGSPSRLDVVPGRIELDAPLTRRNASPELLRQHSLLGICQS